MFLIRHIYVSYPTYFLNDIFCSTTYYTKQNILFNNIYMFLNNIYMFLNIICMSYNIIGHMDVIHRSTTYMISLCNIFLYLFAAITPFVALSVDRSVVQWMLLLRNTQRQLWHLGWYICLSVRGEWDYYSLSRGQTHCPCLHTAVWLPTRVPAYCGPLETPTASWWVWCSLLPRSLHLRCPLTLPWTHGPPIERCVANGKCAIVVGGDLPELGTCSALSVERVPRSLTMGWARGGD